MKIKAYNEKGEVIYEDEMYCGEDGKDQYGWHGITSIGYSYYKKSHPTHNVILNFQQYNRFEIIKEKP